MIKYFAYLLALSILLIFRSSVSFHIVSISRAVSKQEKLSARRTQSIDNSYSTKPPDFTVGENVPEEILRQKAIYDMILVERYSQPEQTTGGLFIPVVEGKDQKHLGKVLSLPRDYGLESEEGRVQPINDLAPYSVGDIVYIKDPWGIGPKDFEIGRRYFSFHKAAHITGVIKRS